MAIAAWENITDQKGELLTVSPDANGIDYVYSCELTYKPNATSSAVRIISNSITVKGYKKLSTGLVYIDNEEKQTSLSICKDSDVDIKLTYTGESNGSYQWQRTYDGTTWEDITESPSITGTKTNTLGFKESNVTKNFLLRCIAIDMCGDKVNSTNSFRVSVNDNLIIADNDIKMLTSRIIPASSANNSLSEFSLSIPTDSKNEYS